MLVVGQMVRVLPPFAEAFPGVYEIVTVITHDDGQIAYDLREIGAFAPNYVEVVEE